MSVKVVFEGHVCTDCALMIANDDSSGIAGYEAWERGVLATGLTERFNGAVVMACPEDCNGEFRTDPCDYCGVNLAGDRHPIVVLSSDR